MNIRGTESMSLMGEARGLRFEGARRYGTGSQYWPVAGVAKTAKFKVSGDS